MPRRDHAHDTRRTDEPARPAARRREEAPARDDGEEGPEQRLLGLQGTIGNAAVEALVANEGSALPDGLRRDMEQSLGHAFGGVRVHEGGDVDRAAARMQAVAFTVGEDVYLGSEAPAPDTAAGRAVLAEELAHVAQGVGADGAERVLPAGDPAEGEAHRAAETVAAGERTTVRAAPAAADAGGRLLDLVAIGYGAYKYLTEEEVQAEKAPPEEKEKEKEDPTAPTPEQVAVITAGVVPQIDAAMKKLAADDVSPLEVANDLLPVDEFLGAQMDPSMEGLVVSARHSVLGAGNTLIASVKQEKTITEMAEYLEADAAALESVAAAAKDPPAPTTGAAPSPDALTTAQASMLRSGPIAWLNQAAGELVGDSPDIDGAIGKIKGVGGALGAIAVPDALEPTFNRHRLRCDTYATTLGATKLSINDAVAQATSQLLAAKSTISAMGAEPPGDVPPTGGA